MVYFIVPLMFNNCAGRRTASSAICSGYQRRAIRHRRPGRIPSISTECPQPRMYVLLPTIFPALVGRTSRVSTRVILTNRPFSTSSQCAHPYGHSRHSCSTRLPLHPSTGNAPTNIDPGTTSHPREAPGDAQAGRETGHEPCGSVVREVVEG